MLSSKPEIVITYCTQCQWLLRAAWLAQELLSTFAEDLGRVSLEPGSGGVFRITYDGRQIWERKADGGFPEAKTLKQRVRDCIDPVTTTAPGRAESLGVIIPPKRGRRREAGCHGIDFRRSQGLHSGR